MLPRKLSVMFATFPYGGNGSTSSETPEVRRWMIDSVTAARNDPRIYAVSVGDFSDTPITMTRNRAVREARRNGCDVLVMVDSDMAPDLYLGSGAPLFFQTAFDFLYDHWDRGPVVVAAPYCGPPPIENVYVFRWSNQESDHPNDVDIRLRQYTREEAAVMSGIHEAAALPTGLCMFAMPVFELTEPRIDTRLESILGRLGPWPDEGRIFSQQDLRALAQSVLDEREKEDQSWFFYEWKDQYQDEKASTEDVTATREISLAGLRLLGYNPIFCAWDCWAGHYKPKCVSKPMLLTAESVSKNLCRAVEESRRSDRKIVCLKERPLPTGPTVASFTRTPPGMTEQELLAGRLTPRSSFGPMFPRKIGPVVQQEGADGDSTDGAGAR